MTVLLIILGSIVSLFVLILLVAAVTKKNYDIQRSIVIDKPVEEVYDYLRHLKNQDHYNKWVMRDPNMKKSYTGNDGEVGFVYAWDGNKQAGAGEQEIKGLKPGSFIDLEIRFIRPFAAIAQGPFELAPEGSGTHVTWGMSSSMKYPMNVMLRFMDMDKLLGRDMEESLRKAKELIEKQ